MNIDISIRFGGDAYVSKPFSTRSLTDRVGELMGDAN